jgi:hypothetical protein
VQLETKQEIPTDYDLSVRFCVVGRQTRDGIVEPLDEGDEPLAPGIDQHSRPHPTLAVIVQRASQ